VLLKRSVASFYINSYLLFLISLIYIYSYIDLFGLFIIRVLFILFINNKLLSRTIYFYYIIINNKTYKREILLIL